RASITSMRRQLAHRRRMLPQGIWRNAVEDRAPCGSQHGRQQLYDERRLQVDEAMLGQQARDHVGVLPSVLGAEGGEHTSRQPQVEADRENMPGADSCAYSNNHPVLRL